MADTDSGSWESSAIEAAWKQTLDRMETIAEERREDGWEVVEVPAIETTTEKRRPGTAARFGLVHAIDADHAEAFEDAFDRDAITEFRVYRNERDGKIFMITELIAPGPETVILIANRHSVPKAQSLIESVMNEGTTYTHVETTDSEVLGTVKHEDVDPFVPEINDVSQWNP